MDEWLEGAYCDGCHRACELTAPRCHFGRQQAAEWIEFRRAQIEQAPKCPGCHCGCSLADAQCGRGEVFAQKWRNGEEIPQRGQRGPGRGPGGPGGQGGPGGSGGPGGPGGQRGPGGPGGPNADPTAKLAFFIPLGMQAFSRASRPLQAGRFLQMLHGQGDWMKYNVLEEKARMDSRVLTDVLDDLERRGSIVRDRWAVRITEAGIAEAARARDWSAEENAELLEVLSDEEKAQFAELWEKLVRHWGSMTK